MGFIERNELGAILGPKFVSFDKTHTTCRKIGHLGRPRERQDSLGELSWAVLGSQDGSLGAILGSYWAPDSTKITPREPKRAI